MLINWKDPKTVQDYLWKRGQTKPQLIARAVAQDDEGRREAAKRLAAKARPRRAADPKKAVQKPAPCRRGNGVSFDIPSPNEVTKELIIGNHGFNIANLCFALMAALRSGVSGFVAQLVSSGQAPAAAVASAAPAPARTRPAAQRPKRIQQGVPKIAPLAVEPKRKTRDEIEAEKEAALTAMIEQSSLDATNGKTRQVYRMIVFELERLTAPLSSKILEPYNGRAVAEIHEGLQSWLAETYYYGEAADPAYRQILETLKELKKEKVLKKEKMDLDEIGYRLLPELIAVADKWHKARLAFSATAPKNKLAAEGGSEGDVPTLVPKW